MDNPEKLATYGTQDDDKQNTTQYNMCWTSLCANKQKSRKLKIQTTGGKDEPNMVFIWKS